MFLMVLLVSLFFISNQVVQARGGGGRGSSQGEGKSSGGNGGVGTGVRAITSSGDHNPGNMGKDHAVQTTGGGSSSNVGTGNGPSSSFNNVPESSVKVNHPGVFKTGSGKDFRNITRGGFTVHTTVDGISLKGHVNVSPKRAITRAIIGSGSNKIHFVIITPLDSAQGNCKATEIGLAIAALIAAILAAILSVITGGAFAAAVAGIFAAAFSGLGFALSQYCKK